VTAFSGEKSDPWAGVLFASCAENGSPVQRYPMKNNKKAVLPKRLHMLNRFSAEVLCLKNLTKKFNPEEK
jgi:hypothetical protein